MTMTLNRNAQSAEQAARLASEAADAARQGSRAVDGVVYAMGNITSTSREIGNIVGVIDSIAFQANILALNAAVEAARAGEQGHGFAVVASEVRGFAQRSSAAARDIKDLIGASTQAAEVGAEQVSQAHMQDRKFSRPMIVKEQTCRSSRWALRALIRRHSKRVARRSRRSRPQPTQAPRNS